MAISVANKDICLFADGTGNAFSAQESNVWRLYDALDKTRVGQIAYYIPGVGTSGFRPWAIVDGATGFGVPSNVRLLYEFLCWNYAPGDRIHLFGFSRGAFTIRALVGMIDSEGLLSRAGPDGTVSRREMRRNVMAAWRSYRRARKKGLRQEAPTIKITRAIRDLVLGAGRLLLRQERYDAVARRSDRAALIDFVGLYDTVEAYGVPVEEMRDAIDWAIWPIKFHDQKLSAKVLRARHALALDDERQTFHPVRFDVSGEAPGSSRIREVWFAGVHSDVGGGYPDGALSLVPLDWMVNEIAGALAFRPDWPANVRDSMSALARAHDSRSGLAVFYRYAPRTIGTGREVGGPPTIHHSVLEKIAFGDELYAPHSLPASSVVLMPDATRVPLAGTPPRKGAPPARQTVQSSSLRNATPLDVARAALDELGAPEPHFIDLVNDGIWLRRKAYFLFLAGCLLVFSLPWTSGPIAFWTGAAARARLDLSGRVEQVNGAVFASLQEVAAAIGGFTPSYLKPWIDAVVRQPLLSAAAILISAALYYANGRLRDRIADDARCAWFARTEGRAPQTSFAQRCARWLRRPNRPRRRDPLLYWPVFASTLAAIVVGSFLLLNRIGLSVETGFGDLCRWEKEQVPRKPEEGLPIDAIGFRTSDPCWDSGFYVEKDFTYELTLEMIEPFLDGPKVVDIAGFRDGSWRHIVAIPLKRWWDEAYFQPIGRIGQTGRVEWPLRSVDDYEPLDLDAGAEVATRSDDVCAPAPAARDIPAIQQKLGIRKRLTTRFNAAESGELFLYVNDAMFANKLLANIALFPRGDCFYSNNSGTAKVTITQLPRRDHPAEAGRH